jgi:class 3 adenylate cyclase
MVGHAQFEPGWRWSTDVKHIVGTEWCEIRHIGYCLGGRLHVLDENGAESEIGPGDVYEIVPGHDAWVVGDELFEGVEFASSRQFGESANEPADRVVATILFTDIVDSTRHLSDMGDLRWRNVLLEHNKEMRRQLDGFRGREIDTTGDGFVALFDSAARAARCARSMTHAVEPLGLEIRAGLHTGEVEKVGGNVRGVAVHVAARVMSLAGAGGRFVDHRRSPIGFRARAREHRSARAERRPGRPRDLPTHGLTAGPTERRADLVGRDRDPTSVPFHRTPRAEWCELLQKLIGAEPRARTWIV